MPKYLVISVPCLGLKQDLGFKDVYKGLRMVDTRLLNCDDAMIGATVYKILSSRLGVKELSKVDIIRHHVVPRFESDDKVKVGI